MAIIIRMGAEAHGTLPAGSDCAVDPETAKEVVGGGLAVVVGGDPADFEAHPDLAPMAQDAPAAGN